MWKLIVGNPWALVALFALGLSSGAVGLNVARSWASGIRGGMSLGSPAKSQP